MITGAEWASRVAGDGCPLDDPRPDSNNHWNLSSRFRVHGSEFTGSEFAVQSSGFRSSQCRAEP